MSARPAAAVIPVRAGLMPTGSAETVAEAGGRCWLVGTGAPEAAAELTGIAVEIDVVEAGHLIPHRLVPALAPILADAGHLLLPHSPDGRDLAPRLAVALGRSLVSAAITVESDRAIVTRSGGQTMATMTLERPVVATFQPGARTAPRPSGVEPAELTSHRLAAEADHDDATDSRIDLVEEVPADPATVDLAEATRIVAAGVGIGSEAVVADVEAVAGLLRASVGATRVITDWGWLPTERQIGTTGVMVDPELYLAVGISGAVQHTAGLGDPAHVVVVNTDPSCPMMELADLALVCDGPAFLTALQALLEADGA